MATSQPIKLPASLVSLDNTTPVVEDRLVKGGCHVVLGLADRNAIPAAVRVAGMLVSVAALKKLFILGTDLSTWTEVQTSTNANGVYVTSDVQIVISAAGTSAERATKTANAPNGFVYFNLTTGNLEVKNNGNWEIVPVTSGPKGDTGDKGLKGDKGDKGDKGNDGAPGLVFKGTWVSSTATYTLGDIVVLNGTAYVCLVSTPNVTKGKSPAIVSNLDVYWAIFAAKGDKGLNFRRAFAINTVYHADDVVSFEGSSYVCIRDFGAVSVIPASLPSFNWALLAAKGDAGDSASAAYVKHAAHHFKNATGADADIITPADIGAVSLNGNQTITGSLEITGTLKASAIYTTLSAAGPVGAAKKGQVIYISSTNKLYYAGTSAWVELANSSALLPTPADIGALALTGGALTGSLTTLNVTTNGDLTVTGRVKAVNTATTAQMDTSTATSVGTVLATALGEGNLVWCTSNKRLYVVINKKFFLLSINDCLPISGGVLTGDLTLGTLAAPADLAVYGASSFKDDVAIGAANAVSNPTLTCYGDVNIRGRLTLNNIYATRNAFPQVVEGDVAYAIDESKLYFGHDSVWTPLAQEGSVTPRRYALFSQLPPFLTGVWNANSSYAIGDVVQVNTTSPAKASYYYAKQVQNGSLGAANPSPSDSSLKWTLISDNINGVNRTNKNSGDWATTVSYVTGDIVRYNGDHYLATSSIAANASNPAPNSSSALTWKSLASTRTGLVLGGTLAYTAASDLWLFDSVALEYVKVLTSTDEVVVQKKNSSNMPVPVNKGTIAYNNKADMLMYSDGSQWLQLALQRGVVVRGYHDPEVFPPTHRGPFNPALAGTSAIDSYKKGDFVLQEGSPDKIYYARTAITNNNLPNVNSQWQLFHDGSESHEGTGFINLVSTVNWVAGTAYSPGDVVLAGKTYYMCKTATTVDNWNVSPAQEKGDTHPYTRNPNGNTWPWITLAATPTGMENVGAIAMSMYGSQLYYLTNDKVWKPVGQNRVPYKMEFFALQVQDNNISTGYHTIGATVATKPMRFSSSSSSAPFLVDDCMATYFDPLITSGVTTGDNTEGVIDFQVIVRRDAESDDPEKIKLIGKFTFVPGSKYSDFTLFNQDGGLDYAVDINVGDVIELRSHFSYGGLKNVCFVLTAFQDGATYNLSDL